MLEPTGDCRVRVKKGKVGNRSLLLFPILLFTGILQDTGFRFPGNPGKIR